MRLLYQSVWTKLFHGLEMLGISSPHCGWTAEQSTASKRFERPTHTLTARAKTWQLYAVIDELAHRYGYKHNIRLSAGKVDKILTSHIPRTYPSIWKTLYERSPFWTRYIYTTDRTQTPRGQAPSELVNRNDIYIYRSVQRGSKMHN